MQPIKRGILGKEVLSERLELLVLKDQIQGILSFPEFPPVAEEFQLCPHPVSLGVASEQSDTH